MPLSSSIVGIASEPAATEIDARWTMAYAAALGDSLPHYMDTLRPAQLVAHPIFPVCFEWPTLTLRIFADSERGQAPIAGVFFEVLNGDGKLAIRDGFVGLRAPESSNR